MEYKPLYWPKDRPVIGGWTCSFNSGFRELGRGYAIEAAQRVLQREKYEPTGDVAFDLRAKTFRDVLLRGTKEAFEESHEGFQSVGLYWQGTFGNPRETERFRVPPTNAAGNYRPSGPQLLFNDDLKDWLFKDFVYSAWMYYRKVDPYEARRRYVALADQLLAKIPGPHQNVMKKWPAWSRKNSPPPLSGDFPGSRRKPATAQPARVNAPVQAPALQAPQPPPAVEQAPAAAQGTLPAPQTAGSIGQTLTAPPEDAPVAGAITDSAAEVSMTPTDNVPKLESSSEQPANMMEDSPQHELPEQWNPEPMDEEELGDADFVIHYSEEDLAKAQEAQQTIGEKGNSGNMVGGIAKHLAIMGGIGAAIGGAVGLGIIAMKHFRIWPFHRPKPTPNKEGQQEEGEGEGGKARKRRRHARSWNKMLTREGFD